MADAAGILRRMAPACGLLAAGTAGGFLFKALGLPLPWTLGAMTAAGILAVSGVEWKLPPAMRDGARPVIGVVAGSAFTPAVMAQAAGWLPVLAAVAGFLLLACVAGAVFFHKICGYDRRTSLLAAMPGGLSEITILGADFGADVRRLVLVHSVRIVLVVMSAPFLIMLLTGRFPTTGNPASASTAIGLSDWLILGACGLLGLLGGRRLNRFGGTILVPLAASALVHVIGLTASKPPYWLIAGMQVVIGCIAGGRFGGMTAKEARAVVRQGLAWALVLLAAAAAFAEGLSHFFGPSDAALFLALAPGGFAEMVAISVAIGIETAFVVACQTVRLLLVLTLAPILLPLLERRGF